MVLDPEYGRVFSKQTLSPTPGQRRAISTLFQLFKIPVTPALGTTKNRVSGEDIWWIERRIVHIIVIIVIRLKSIEKDCDKLDN